MKTMQEFLYEAIKGWKNVHGELMKGRSESSQADNHVELHVLKKDGTPSGMHDARTSFKTEEEAVKHHETMKSLNPKKGIKHHLIVNNKVERVLV